MHLRYVYTDSGNCRVCFKQGTLRYCLQQEGRDGGFVLYRCSRDGEPQWECQPQGVTYDLNGMGSDRIEREARAWIED